MEKIALLLIFLSFLEIQSLSYCYKDINTIKECQSMIDDSIAFATKDESEGWKLFTVSTNDKSDITKQAYGAGFLEGYLYVNNINHHFYNVKDYYLKGSSDLSEKLTIFLQQQKAFYTEIANKRSNDYEEALYLIIQQHEGMWQGYQAAYPIDGDKTLPIISQKEFNLLADLGELVDLIPAFPKPKQYPFPKERGDCTAFVRLIENKMYVAHNTHNPYSMMNRIFKFYNFNMKLTSGKVINGYKFNSRPGDLNSKDDYFQLTNEMCVLETSLDICDVRKYYKLSPLTVPKWIRTSIANKLATDNEEWIKIFMKHNSGTHNNQWVIINIKRFLAGKKTKVVNIVEQTPNIDKDALYTEDMSAELFRDSYFASYNAAYFQKSKEDTGCPDSKDYFHANRYFILKDLNKKVETLDDIKRIMTYHDASELCNTIGARCDLLTDGKRPYGAIDVKLTDSERIKTMKNHLLYGIPHYDGISKPFDWNDWPEIIHNGLEQVSDFKWIDF